jgi:hypothetical protein
VSGNVTVTDTADAARLVALGMRPKLLPSRDLVYADLVRRHQADETFADLVTAVADGLGLVVLAVSAQTGVVLAATEESPFAVRMDDYARRTAVRDRSERVLHGLIHLAVAALAYPRPDDLANDTYIGRVSVEQVDGVVREACRMLEEKARTAEENSDPLADAPELERVWRVYARRPTATKDGRLAPDTTRSMINKGLKFLAEQGFLVPVSAEGGGTYRSTPRYQVQVRELAADAALSELLDLGVISVTDPTGSLHIVGDAL